MWLVQVKIASKQPLRFQTCFLILGTLLDNQKFLLFKPKHYFFLEKNVWLILLQQNSPVTHM